jgi:hypothetical protein
MTDDVEKIEAEIKDLDLDYMRGLMSEAEYNGKLADLKARLEQSGGDPTKHAAAVSTAPTRTLPTEAIPKRVMTDPVTAVKNTIQDRRRIPIEAIAQESGVDAVNVTKILVDLIDGRELSGMVDHDSGDFVLGTGTGPTPKSIAACPYCRNELGRVAVKGETITCNVCRESFIVS